MTKIAEALQKILNIVVAVLIAVLVLVGGLQVLNRFLIKVPMPWTEELSRMLFIQITFLGAALALKRGAYAVLDIIFERFPGKLQFFLGILNNLLIMGFMVLIIFLSTDVLKMTSLQVTPALNIPQAWVYATIPICCFFTFIFSLESTFLLIRKHRTESIN